MRYTDGFTGKAILALKEAICAAEELGHTYIGSEHLLLGLLEEGSNAAAAMLAAQHITAQRVRNALAAGKGIFERRWSQPCRNGTSPAFDSANALLYSSCDSEEVGR